MNGPGWAIYAAWVLGVGLVIYGLGMLYLKRRRFRKAFQEEGKSQEDLFLFYKNKRVRSFKEYIENRAGFAGTSWRFPSFLAYSLLTGAAGAFIAVNYLQNPFAVLPLALAFLFIPWLYLSFFIARREILLEQQLIPAIQFFISEYGSLPNIVSALHNILPLLDYPLQDEFNRLLLELNSGRDSEEALFAFSGRINSRWAYRLSHIFNLRMKKGLNINTMLFNLYMDMKTKRVQDRERRSETAAARAESLILYLAIPAVYFLAARISPQSHYLLTRTPLGQKAMLLVILLVLFGVIATVKLGGTKITVRR
ncbi:MAG: hypothetical protein RBT41_10330 [Clostridia bacterium]|nr:hypothetical protein [Clostridia bacterium]